ncbi:enoyl-CoA hydratase/isomerase family protein [Roseibium denhamense]|uniref:2-(1,2-epoxy-1,2-dihydrophenyl)acetyl-CoA isomerase n=1 Tax=Roseibium denhamense TaxID=76305 RepID=A0ABY1NIJ0_9HYPH|nr:enoyl-CoA hydratase/isomerase family protein [Roseibium denhamense]MTI05046.1 enoyl-CoA hydratase/isomerase family protein [Roseibium denhamense]SMP10086.1 2-(1,2-epoxy-1,2-dihydrophenyl)acetyl-CoA isomerase [Roseibium denhamense]
MSFVGRIEQEGVVWLWLDRPQRHNALIPELVRDLRSSLAWSAAQQPKALVLTGRGRSFSTGGDIAGFIEHAASAEALSSYANQLVGGLHDAIMDLLKFPAPVITSVNGPVTGGAAGFVLAADMVAMSDSAFIQPYYSEVGFAPDGGWTALLPERIGTAKALEIQYLNRQISAQHAERLGLANIVRPTFALEDSIRDWLDDLTRRSGRTHTATRSNIWDADRLTAVKRRLDQEQSRFLDLITMPETLQGMQSFIQRRA